MNPTREWWPVWEASHYSSTQTSKRFRIFNWNILAPHFVDPFLYKDIKPSLLEWETRVFTIVKCILAYKPDIVTLQEMPESTYHSLFLSTLRQHGYDGYFVPKSFLKTSTKLDGVATFWRSSRFSILERKSVRFNISSLMDRPQVACLVFLQDQLQVNERLLVANTHLLFNINRGEVKIGQLQLLMLSIWSMLKRWCVVQILTSEILQFCCNKDDTQCWKGIYEQACAVDKEVIVLRDIPGIVMCGDFNITPNSTLYEWIRRGQFEFTNTMKVTSFSGQGTLLTKTYKIDPDAREMRGTAPSFTSCGEDSQCNTESKENQGSRTASRSQSELLQRNSSISEYSSPRQTVSQLANILHPVKSGEIYYLFSRLSVLWAPAGILNRANINFNTKGLSRHENKTVLENKLNLSGKEVFNLETSTVLYHPFCWKSSYARPCTGDLNDKSPYLDEKEPAYTAFHGWQKGCIDYVWYSSNELQVNRLLEFPRIDVLNKIQNLPHQMFPGSDHFYLVVDFIWTEPKNRVVAVIL